MAKETNCFYAFNSKLKVAIANVLQQEGYISNVEVADAMTKSTFTIT